MTTDINRRRHHDRRRRDGKRRRQHRGVRIIWSRFLISIAIMAAAIILVSQIVTTCNSCRRAAPEIKESAPLTIERAVDSAAILGRLHAADYRALSPDTNAMCDYLLEVRGRATDFGRRFGQEASSAYTSAFEREAFDR